MKVVSLSLIEFWEDVWGPGPKQHAKLTKSFATHATKPGSQDRELQPTGLVILWDPDRQAVYLVQPDAKVRPVVVIDQKAMRNSEPEEWDWIKELAEDAATSPRKART